MLDYQMWDILVNYSSKAKETPQGSLKSPGCINIFRDSAVGQKTQQRQHGHYWCFSPTILRKTFVPPVPVNPATYQHKILSLQPLSKKLGIILFF
jgi:hypothetical protein